MPTKKKKKKEKEICMTILEFADTMERKTVAWD